MKRINFLEESYGKEPVVNRTVQNFLLFFGERLVIILFTAVVFGFAFFNTTQKVFSENSDSKFVKADTDWYFQDISFPIAQDLTGTTFAASIQAIPTPTPTPAPTIKPSSGDNDVWEKLADCESHKNWGANTGNGYYGGLQFSHGAWNSVGGTGLPSDASRDEQIMRGKILQERRGWGPWGMCSKKLGLL